MPPADMPSMAMRSRSIRYVAALARNQRTAARSSLIAAYAAVVHAAVMFLQQTTARPGVAS
jgi:hypothetical protein